MTTGPKRPREELRHELASSVDDAEWAWLKSHHARGAVLLVARDQDLIEVALGVALDDVALVKGWLASGALAHVTEEQARHWEAHPETPFRFVIVQPYVLAQERYLN